MLTIELKGTDTAMCGGLKVTHKTGPIGRLARKLINAGADGNEHVRIMRGDTECFNRMSLSAWSATTTIERDNVSVRMGQHVPFSAEALSHTMQS